MVTGHTEHRLTQSFTVIPLWIYPVPLIFSLIIQNDICCGVCIDTGDGYLIKLCKYSNCCNLVFTQWMSSRFKGLSLIIERSRDHWPGYWPLIGQRVITWLASHWSMGSRSGGKSLFSQILLKSISCCSLSLGTSSRLLIGREWSSDPDSGLSLAGGGGT